MNLSEIKALTFDVFGTVTDWRSTIIHEGATWGQQKGITLDWARFADDWRSGYEPAMHRVRMGQLPWLNIDRIHRLILEELLVKYGITGLTEAEKAHWNQVWHRLELWPDVRLGVERLRQRFVVAPLSNGNLALLTNMAKHADLRWDCILSAELSRHYKPDPEVYLTAADLLGLAPHAVLMVAAHNHDLKGAQAVGFRTAFVHRPTEYGPQQTTDLTPDPSFDLVAYDFNDLADQLVLYYNSGCRKQRISWFVDYTARFKSELGYVVKPVVFSPAAMQPIKEAIDPMVVHKARQLQQEGLLADICADAPFEKRLAKIQAVDQAAAQAIVHHIWGKGGGGYSGPAMLPGDSGLLSTRSRFCHS